MIKLSDNSYIITHNSSLMTQLSVSLKDLVELHTAEMYRWVLHKVSDEELAKDLVQNTFLAAAEKFGSFSGNSSHKTWLFAILNNKIVDHYRNKVGKVELTDSFDTGDIFSGNGSWKRDKATIDWHGYVDSGSERQR